MPQFDPRTDYRLKYPEGDDLGDVIDCANYDSIDRSQIGKLMIFGESGVDIEELWEVIKLEVTDKDYPVETAFFFAWIKRNDPSNKAVAIFVQKVEKENAIDRLMQVCNGYIQKSDIKWKTEEATQAGHYSEKDYKGRGKTTPCKFFQIDRCNKGDACTFLH